MRYHGYEKAGNKLFLVGRLTENIGGSQYVKALKLIGGIVPRPDAKEAIAIHKAMHGAITAATVRSCHDVSEGGLAVTIAEMAFAGGIGADIHGLNTLGNIPFAAMLLQNRPPVMWLKLSRKSRTIPIHIQRSASA